MGQLTMDFLIIGAAKSGTSTLWSLMRGHPDIWMPTPKELPFFNGPDYELGWEEFARRHLGGAPPGAKIGKAAPGYMSGAAVGGDATTHREREIPERIARRFPDIKLIAILRDPVKRALSQYAMARNLGLESRDPDTAFEELLEPSALAEARRNPPDLKGGYVVLGEYARILQGYLDVFEPSQLLVLQTTRLAEDPESLLASVWRFIGVDDYVPDDLDTRRNVSSDLTPWQRVFVEAVDDAPPAARAARRVVRALPPAIRAPVRRRVFAVFRYVASRKRGGTSSSSPPDYQLSPKIRGRLFAHYEADSANLETMFGWSPLGDGSPGSAGEPGSARGSSEGQASPTASR
jgi:hypothetical protein